MDGDTPFTLLVLMDRSDALLTDRLMKLHDQKSYVVSQELLAQDLQTWKE